APCVARGATAPRWRTPPGTSRGWSGSGDLPDPPPRVAAPTWRVTLRRRTATCRDPRRSSVARSHAHDHEALSRAVGDRCGAPRTAAAVRPQRVGAPAGVRGELALRVAPGHRDARSRAGR